MSNRLFSLIPSFGLKAYLKCIFTNVKCLRDQDYKLSYRRGMYILKIDGKRVLFHAKDLSLPDDFFAVKGYVIGYRPKPGDHVMDIGSYQGTFTLLSSVLVGPEGRVYAYEPDPKNYEALKKNIELNGFTNVIPINKGVWNEDKVLRFDGGKEELSHFLNEGEDEQGSSMIEAVALDNEVSRLGLTHVDLVKMDIEGAEIEALQGAPKLLMSKTNWAIASYHIVDGKKTCEHMERVFRANGYSPRSEYSHLTTYALR